VQPVRAPAAVINKDTVKNRVGNLPILSEELYFPGSLRVKQLHA
jgi:hypothetical protein